MYVQDRLPSLRVGGFFAMGKNAVSVNANVFQFFTRNPRGGAAKDLDEKDIAAFRELASAHGIIDLLAHAPYTLNACSNKEHLRGLPRDNGGRYQAHGIPARQYVQLSPGAHMGQGLEAGIDMIAELLNTVLYPEQTTTVLLETMAGKGTECGGRFEHIRAIIDKVMLNDKLASALTPATFTTPVMISRGIWTGCWLSLTGSSGSKDCAPSILTTVKILRKPQGPP
jgi:deoxyribonuclease-4